MEPNVLILRDPRESTKKCSLTPLRGMPGVRFVDFRSGRRVDAASRVLLHPEGELLGASDGVDDAGEPRPGLLLLDCSWRRVPQLLEAVDGDPVRRRLPPLATAYPRRSRVFEDPEQGLASVEALYAAFRVLGIRRRELLDEYRWAEDFLRQNPQLA